MDKLDIYIKKIEDRLYDVFPKTDELRNTAADAAKYSLSAGGKRIRPVLTLAFCEMCGGNPDSALDAACAIEYIHTFSLIHDDLPCMDNDDLRRGKPSCHKQYDEPTALLAGDALAILPFALTARSKTIPPSAALKCISAIAECAGLYGMIYGQQIDTEYTGKGKQLPDDKILFMYGLKTSALIRAACMCGVYCAGSEKEDLYIKHAAEYANSLGTAFQIIDDILDVTGNEAELGKKTGMDAQLNKNTYVHAFGLDEAEDTAGEYTKRAVDALSVFDNNDFVKRLTLMLLGRKN